MASGTRCPRRSAELHRSEMADIYLMTAERYEHDAIFIHPNPNTLDETKRLIDLIRAAQRRPLLSDDARRRHLQHPQRRDDGRVERLALRAS